MMDTNELANKRIKIVSAHNSDLSIVYPELRVNRNLVGIGASVTLAGDIVRELLSDIGFKYMLEQGMIIIANKEDRIALGLEEEGIIVPIEFKKDDMIKALRGMAYADFVKGVDSMTKEQQRTLAQLAVDEQIGDLQKTDLLKRYTGMDVLKMIMLNRESAAKEAELAATGAPKTGQFGPTR